MINVGIREQLLIGVTGGLALAGLRPIAHTFPSFLVERPFEQVKLDLGHQDVGAILVSYGGSYDMSTEGRTHQSPGDIALLGTLDGWTIQVPGHPDEAELLLRTSAARNDRVYLRLSAQSNAEPRPAVPDRFLPVRTGRRGTVIAVGPMLQPVLDAVADLEPSVPPTSWMHRLEMTSFTFMFDWVPGPVWDTCSGNSVSSAPLITSSQTRSISSPFQGGSRPARVLTTAAAFSHTRRRDRPLSASGRGRC